MFDFCFPFVLYKAKEKSNWFENFPTKEKFNVMWQGCFGHILLDFLYYVRLCFDYVLFYNFTDHPWNDHSCFPAQPISVCASGGLTNQAHVYIGMCSHLHCCVLFWKLRHSQFYLFFFFCSESHLLPEKHLCTVSQFIWRTFEHKLSSNFIILSYI